jgi:hypothetical protein
MPPPAPTSKAQIDQLGCDQIVYVVRAEAQRSYTGKGPYHHVVLVFTDGRQKQPGAWSSAGGIAASQLCDRINGVLASVRGDGVARAEAPSK